MTDITELAQRMKAAAERVIKNYDSEWFETGSQICTVHKSKINLISLANPVNVLALVEALEKAQDTINEMDNRIRKQNRHVCELFDDNTALRQRIAELEEAEQQLCSANVTLDARAELAERQLAELESRTVTVKLPQAVSAGGQGYQEKVERILTAAGIKWEAE